MSEFAEDKAKRVNKRNWVSLVPYGLNEQHPNNYCDIVDSIWENRDNLGYALRILRDGCCDGCSLGTSGVHDWTMKGIHLCAVRLQLMRLNTMPAMDARLFEDAGKLRGLSERQLRKLGRLPVPMVRHKGDKGFQAISWDDATGLIADKLREIDPKRIAWYMTSRGLTNEQKCVACPGRRWSRAQAFFAKTCFASPRHLARRGMPSSCGAWGSPSTPMGALPSRSIR